MAKASIEFQQQQTVYQAALAAGSMVIQPTLVDFLR
jgi:flagellin-like hook-associated protein FlgL